MEAIICRSPRPLFLFYRRRSHRLFILPRLQRPRPRGRVNGVVSLRRGPRGLFPLPITFARTPAAQVRPPVQRGFDDRLRRKATYFPCACTASPVTEDSKSARYNRHTRYNLTIQYHYSATHHRFPLPPPCPL